MKFKKTEVVDGRLVPDKPLYVKVIRPCLNEYLGQKFPVVVTYPGALGRGGLFDLDYLDLAKEGYIEVHFDARGRGRSPGNEDYNGLAHQNDLKDVINWIASKPNVDRKNIGVYSMSFGITATASCLGRYPDLPVKFLVDSEGPHNSFASTCEAWLLDNDDDSIDERTDKAWDMLDGHQSTQRDPSEANKKWWAHREAIKYIGKISCAYLRLQGVYDHAQPHFDFYPDYFPNQHAIEMNNKAVDGSALWTRINLDEQGNLPNTKFSYAEPPVYLDVPAKSVGNEALKYMFSQRFK